MWELTNFIRNYFITDRTLIMGDCVSKRGPGLCVDRAKIGDATTTPYLEEMDKMEKEDFIHVYQVRFLVSYTLVDCFLEREEAC